MARSMWPLAGLAVAAFVSQARAADVTPDFSQAPTGWVTDRTAPDSFGNIGTQNGLDNVLGITVGTNPPANTGNFYHTEGMQTPITGGAGDSVSVKLFIPQAWLSATNGAVQTGIWIDTTAQSDFGILAFTNVGTGTGNADINGNHDLSYVGLMAWVDSANGGNGGWIELSGNPLTGDSWVNLTISDTGGTFDYLVDGTTVASESIATPTLQTAFVEAVNFTGDTAYPDVSGTPYTAKYANIPEPASMALLGVGLVALSATRRKRR